MTMGETELLERLSLMEKRQRWLVLTLIAVAALSSGVLALAWHE
jgi:hypothetical protein